MTTSYFQVGQRLTDYSGVDVTVEREASGGYGAVAMGPDRAKGGRWWALKALRPDVLTQAVLHGGPEAQDRLRNLFLREALTWKGLWPHPNLLTAQFVTEINGQLMLVLDYAEQGSLRDIFEDARRQGQWLTFGSALDLAQQIAAGLVALHTPDPSMLRNEPIVHRDLKPENVLINQYGSAMITDFGLAKAVAEALAPNGASDPLSRAAQPAIRINGEALTAIGVAPVDEPVVAERTQAYRTERGQALGTPAYMAPEQWLDAAMADRPADAYAFGIILAELLTNRHPLLNLEQRHTLPEWRVAHASGRSIPLSKLGADVFTAQRAALPDAQARERLETALARTERLLARLLAKLPSARPTLPETLTELQQAARDLGDEPYRPSETYPHTAEHERIIWQGWANACYRFGLLDQALVRIERAYALAPHHPNVLSSFGNILAGLGRREEAIERYREALAETPYDDIQGRKIILNQLGNRLSSGGRFAEAEEAYTEALTHMPAAADTWDNRAHNQMSWALDELEAGRRDSASAHVDRGLEYSARAFEINPNLDVARSRNRALRQLRDRL